MHVAERSNEWEVEPQIALSRWGEHWGRKNEVITPELHCIPSRTQVDWGQLSICIFTLGSCNILYTDSTWMHNEVHGARCQENHLPISSFSSGISSGSSSSSELITSLLESNVYKAGCQLRKIMLQSKRFQIIVNRFDEIELMQRIFKHWNLLLVATHEDTSITWIMW